MKLSEPYPQILAGIIDDIHHELAILYINLPSAHIYTPRAREVRTNTIRLEKLFKRFREISCKAGMK